MLWEDYYRGEQKEEYPTGIKHPKEFSKWAVVGGFRFSALTNSEGIFWKIGFYDGTYAPVTMLFGTHTGLEEELDKILVAKAELLLDKLRADLMTIK